MNELEQAALNNLFEAGMPNPSKWYPPDEAALVRHQAWVDEKRAWVAAIQDRRTRRAYMMWIDCTQRQIDQCREENRTHAERNRDEANRKRWDEEARRVSALAKTLPAPPR